MVSKTIWKEIALFVSFKIIIRVIMKLRYLIFTLFFLSSCSTYYSSGTNKEEDIYYTSNYTFVECKYKIMDKKIIDSIDSGYGQIYGYVMERSSNDTIQGIETIISPTRIHVLSKNIDLNVDGLYNIKLPIGKYRICVEGLFYPIVNEIEIKNKESIQINYYLGAKYIH